MRQPYYILNPYIKPNDPAVIPTQTKKPNYNNPCAEAGVLMRMLLKNERSDICVCYEGYDPDENCYWHLNR